MTQRYRVNPLLSCSWQRDNPTGKLTFVALDPLSKLNCAIASSDFWLLELLNNAYHQSWTLQDTITLAEDRYKIEETQAKNALTRIWPVAFIEQSSFSADLEKAMPLWASRGAKLALEYFANSLRQKTAVSQSNVSNPNAGEVIPGAVPLPQPEPLPAKLLHEIFKARRTCRDFLGHQLKLEHLSFILAHALCAPCKNSAYSANAASLPEELVCHLFAMRVTGLDPGIYAYRPITHELGLVRALSSQALEQEMTELLIGQTYVVGSAAGILISGNLDRLIQNDGRQSTYRKWLVRVGSLAQRFILLGHAKDITSFLSAAINTQATRRITNGAVGGTVKPAHMVVFGGRED